MKEVNPETFTVDISEMNKRKAFVTMKDFVLGDECYQGEILAVYGLKRTGKTTLLKQLLCNIDAYTSFCAVLEMQDSDTMKMLERRIEEEQAKGKTVIFINEITKVSDFINNSASLADCFAKAGARIIISGTDSLSIAFAEDYELYDRVRKVNTTYTSFAEYHTLFPLENIYDYIRYGGLFYKNEAEKSLNRYENILSYLYDAVTMNIANSLKFGNITVFADNATVALTNANGDAIDSKYVIGNGETVNLTATAKDGYSIVKVKVGSTEYPTGSAITITGTGDPIEVEVITTSTTTNSVTKVADITETETLAGFVAKVIATDASAKYGAILKSGSDEKVIYAMKSESDSATVADSSYYAVKVTNTDGKAAKGDYTLTPFVEVNGTKTYGDAITFKVE